MEFDDRDPETVAEMLSRCVTDANIPAMVVTLGGEGAVWADLEGNFGL